MGSGTGVAGQVRMQKDGKTFKYSDVLAEQTL